MIALALAVALLAPADASWRQDECRFGGLEPGGWTRGEVARTIACAVSKWPVSGGLDKAMDVAGCESGLRATAYNPNGYAGVYQHATRYWPARVENLEPVRWDKRLGRSVFDARSNIVVAIRYVRAYGWSAWTCA